MIPMVISACCGIGCRTSITRRARRPGPIQWNWPGGSFSEILGTKGMKVYRELAEAEWEKVPGGTSRHERSEWGQHFRITQIMESLAQASGDIEQLVAVMSRDLSSAYSYWKIAEVYREARQHDRALLWAEKGLQAFPDHTDGRLREFAAEEYHRRRRHDDAMKLMWAEFSERPYLESYKTLERHAKKAGAWPGWRERALAEIQLRITKVQREGAGPEPPTVDAARRRSFPAGGDLPLRGQRGGGLA
jgi:hypothetical protein